MPEAVPPDPQAWDAWTPLEVASRLRPLEIPWAIAGGWALDLFVGSKTRHHADIEVVIDRSSLGTVRAALQALEWFGVGSRQISPTDDVSRTLGQTWGWDKCHGCWRVDVISESWDDDSWVYRRDASVRLPLAEAIERTVDGIPYLVPQIVLLFKAKTPREKDEFDFARLLPLLDSARRSWLAAALQAAHPGHSWLPLLAG